MGDSEDQVVVMDSRRLVSPVGYCCSAAELQWQVSGDSVTIKPVIGR